MRRPPLPVLLVSVALVLAGCSTPLGRDVTTPEPTGTTTTATDTPPTPGGTTSVTQPRTTMAGGETPPSDAAAYPPGVSQDGITNLTALEHSHRQSLSGRAVTAVGTWNLSTPTGLRSRSVRIETGPGGVPALVVEHERENGTVTESTAQWGNETVSLTRSVRDGETTYRSQLNPDTLGAAGERTDLFALLDDGAFDLVSIDGPPGAREYTLTATDSELDDRRAEHVTLHEYHGTIVVHERGTIQRANVTATIQPANETGTVESAGDRHTVRTRFRLRDRDSATVDEPAWVRERLGPILDKSITATLVDDRFVRVEHTGRATIDAGSEFLLWYDGCGRATTTLSEPFAPGETLYVYVSANESYDLGINRTGPAGPARSISHPSDFIVFPPSDDDGRPDPVARADVAEGDATRTTASGSSALPLRAGVASPGSTAGC